MQSNNDERLEKIHSALSSWYHCFKYLEAVPKDLLTALKIHLPHLDPESWEERFNWGGIYLNGKAVAENRTLPTPCKIEYYEPKTSIAEQKKSFPKFSSEWIIYEDENFAVVYKPCGLSTQKAKEQWHFSLYHYLLRHYGHHIHLPSRLDFSTAGLILTSKTSETHKAAQQLFTQKKIKKQYLLKVSKTPDWETKTVENLICRDPFHPVLRMTSDIQGKPAKTIFYNQGNNIILAEPITGRTHQIRVHAAYALNLPITGDKFYNGKKANFLHLLSYKLSFIHPLRRQSVNVHLPSKYVPNPLKLSPQVLRELEKPF